MPSSRSSSRRRSPELVSAAGPAASPRQAVARSVRALDLLQPAEFPIHPFDQAHGVDTSGLVPARYLVTGSPSDEHVTAYYGVAPSILRALIALWRESVPPHPISSYTFVDIGAGKGRGVMIASQFHFRQVLGIELNPALASIARSNVQHWSRLHASDPTAARLAPIAIHQHDAVAFDYPDSPLLLFLFHPFEAPVLRQLLRRLETRFAARERSAGPPALDILYVNAECAGVLDRHPGFTRLFLDSVKMSPEDHAADLEAIAQQKEYGSTGDEQCAIYRYTGRTRGPVFTPPPAA